MTAPDRPFTASPPQALAPRGHAGRWLSRLAGQVVLCAMGVTGAQAAHPEASALPEPPHRMAFVCHDQAAPGSPDKALGTTANTANTNTTSTTYQDRPCTPTATSPAQPRVLPLARGPSKPPAKATEAVHRPRPAARDRPGRAIALTGHRRGARPFEHLHQEVTPATPPEVLGRDRSGRSSRRVRAPRQAKAPQAASLSPRP